MHEHIQQSVLDLVRDLEQRGYDRQSALKLLMDVVDRQAFLPPKARLPGRPPQQKAM